MPVISRTDKQSWAGRVTIALMYAFLIAGSVAMIYPFLLMLSGSTKSGWDSAESRIIPRYLVDDTALFRKFLEGQYNEAVEYFRLAWGGTTSTFARAEVPPAVSPGLMREWREFEQSASLPAYFYSIGFMSTGQSRGVTPSNSRAFIAYLQERHGRTVGEVNRALGATILSWNAFEFRPQNFYQRGQVPRQDGLAAAYREWQVLQPPQSRFYFNLEGFYRAYLRNQFGADIAGYNRSRGTDYAGYDAIILPRRAPLAVGDGAVRADWLGFVRSIVNPLWVRVDEDLAGQGWAGYLQARYGSVEAWNAATGGKFTSFETAALPENIPLGSPLLQDWISFLQGWQDPSGVLHAAPDESLSLHDVQFAFRDHLAGKFGTIEKFREATGGDAGGFEQVQAPLAASDHETFLGQKQSLRWEFTVRNYRSVWGYLAVNGRGILNTVIFCTLAVGVALIFNPIAAYALSRFRPPLTYKLLLFLMLTMAFPPMVTQIPVFLMLREFNLLNTFAALILPGLANGYSIFLLKGFFDSLPRELYESCEIDGASEWVIFWQITMSLSKPILAVIALGAFTGAYSAFMFALLICQDQSMWTIMVWLYQLQQRSGEGVVFASLLIAAVPTLLVFVFAQKVIMRGIAVPVEK